ncbi:endolytic transglycosylase MltG [Alteromonas sp. a30]|uniref:endolytic transglycosylase MltG n=1 Tax=Alteromonas sp. a30 TaxID=2730917 RepID=UPI002280986F|nr:endolytic transglycosylase MltG [Alteromonas sp. a30]MCY7294059.1 endolytic transglycosylase MltG [Alteromonas sp. a30]
MQTRTWLKYSFLFIVAFALIVFGVTSYQINRFLQQPLTIQNNAIFNIHSGESVSGVFQRLPIEDDALFTYVAKIYFRLNPAKTHVQAGVYELLPSDSLASVLSRFNQGQTKKVAITLIEGKTWREWYQVLLENPWLQMDLNEGELLSSVNAVSGWQLSHLEGAFMPDTYHIEAGSKFSTLMMQAHQSLQRFVQRSWEERAQNLPIDSPYEALILASIIEKETGLAEERGHIASVFINRLNLGMRLQTDPTVIYGIGTEFDGNLTRKHLKTVTPYNTYRIKGLPPTPIAMPSRAAITAALNPIQSDDLYFVAKGDGSHAFSKTLNEHNEAVRRYQLGIQ